MHGHQLWSCSVSGVRELDLWQACCPSSPKARSRHTVAKRLVGLKEFRRPYPSSSYRKHGGPWRVALRDAVGRADTCPLPRWLVGRGWVRAQPGTRCWSASPPCPVCWSISCAGPPNHCPLGANPWDVRSFWNQTPRSTLRASWSGKWWSKCPGRMSFSLLFHEDSLSTS